MKAFLIIFLSLLVISSYSQDSICNSLLWNDEFDYTGAPDTKKWGYDIGGGGWGNNELQTYTNSRDNSWVEDGKLFIKAIKKNNAWTSARLVTKGKGDWLYGRIEIRAKVPAGRGIWSAIWMLPTDWAYGGWPKSGEIDIMEHVGYDVNRIYGTIHTESFNHSLNTQQGSNILVPTAYDEFHDYAVEWDEEKIKIFVDDKPYFTFNNRHTTYKEWPFDKREHLLLNIAIGGSWGGSQGIDPNISEAIMEIEHVRVYELKPEKPVVTGSGLVVPGQEVIFSTKNDARYSFNWTFPDDVQVVSGSGTNEIKVKWGNNDGSVKVDMLSPCDTISSDPFEVRTTSDGNIFIIDNYENEEIEWKAVSSLNNTINLLKDENDAVRVNFEVGNTTANPCIEYTFSSPFNFREYCKMVVNIKTEEGKSPSNLRIDLVDVNGLTDQGNLFKIDSPVKSGNFEAYAHTFGKGNSTFNIEKISKIKIYFNYSVYGEKGSGYFIFNPIQMKIPSSSSTNLNSSNLKIYPNPVIDYLTVENKNGGILNIYDNMGRVVFTKKINPGYSEKIILSFLKRGIYYLRISNEGETFNSEFIKI